MYIIEGILGVVILAAAAKAIVVNNVPALCGWTMSIFLLAEKIYLKCTISELVKEAKEKEKKDK